MTPIQLLHELRGRGYKVQRGADGRLQVSGPRPRSPKRAEAMLKRYQPELLAVLSIEQHRIAPPAPKRRPAGG